MKKCAIITVAGSSTRFRDSIGNDVLKCLYTEGTEKDTLLYKLISLHGECDKIVIVGGYKFDELTDFINKFAGEYISKIIVVKNEHYVDFGSGYSLYMGIKEAQKYGPQEIIFSEGDLAFDSISFKKILDSKKSVVSTNMDPIEARKAVAFYINKDGVIKYIYDTAHSLLAINEPFLGIYNSGQVWKFTNALRLFEIVESLNQQEIEGTNLIIVQKYFQALSRQDFDVIGFEKWINCNTVEDYRKIGDMK
ncbi:MAG: hypothetical protein K6E69_00455 [Treponema sp.]|uniref:DUF6564 domain-containing protein n=1 Tax=Treponema sp. TaxID=166 RepID=UPI00298E273F|nr:DUF6564 domain-containing protein [Treponema sp.]MCR5385570.1 hypothetical protein [Treponema sp.]